MEAQASAYSLKALFISEGAYLAAVSIRITDHGGNTVLDSVSKGPMLLINLPPGRYRVEAKGPNGSVVEQRVHISQSRTSTLVFRFPASEL